MLIPTSPDCDERKTATSEAVSPKHSRPKTLKHSFGVGRPPVGKAPNDVITIVFADAPEQEGLERGKCTTSAAQDVRS